MLAKGLHPEAQWRPLAWQCFFSAEKPGKHRDQAADHGCRSEVFVFISVWEPRSVRAFSS